MKKIIIFCVCIVVLIAVLIIGNLKDTTIATGTLVDNGETEVTIKITRTNFDKLFNRLSKEITVEGDDIQYRYVSNDNNARKYDGIYNVYIYAVRNGDPLLGLLFFDKDMQNIVIHTSCEDIYSADEEFIEMADWGKLRSEN